MIDELIGELNTILENQNMKQKVTQTENVETSPCSMPQ